MGKLILLALLVLAAVLVWKAFGPASWNHNRQAKSAVRPAIKGPDDDEEFLWNIEKNRFKERRRQEQEQQRHKEQRQSRNHGTQQDTSRATDSPDPQASDDVRNSDRSKNPGDQYDENTDDQ